jgi:hypothetical protein
MADLPTKPEDVDDRERNCESSFDDRALDVDDEVELGEGSVLTFVARGLTPPAARRSSSLKSQSGKSAPL